MRGVVQHWSAMSQLQPAITPGEWYMFDKTKRIAIIRYVTISGRRLLRSVTFDNDPAQRILIGYFPDDALRLAADCTWSEYIRHSGPSISNRR